MNKKNVKIVTAILLKRMDLEMGNRSINARLVESNF
jgi:hypothetical protein